MAVNLKGRSLVTFKDYTPAEIAHLIDLSHQLKTLKYIGVKQGLLKNKNIALIFEKPSTRTRCAFIVAAADEGAHADYLGKGDIQLGKKESVKDTARVLGRMFDGIQFRGFSHKVVEELAQYAGVPVWNGLTDLAHPTQVLADFLTIQECKGRLRGIALAYVGDGRNNMALSLLEGAAKMGMDFRIVSPRELFPDPDFLAYSQGVAQENGATVTVTDSIDLGVKNADAIYTDVWVSMGEEKFFEQRIKLLKPYQVNMTMLKKAKKDVIFLHCLPAFHNRETSTGEEIFQKFGIAEMEVTEEVFESSHSVVFDQAENRMHTIKAVMVATVR
jgi:ornithine carbamoyltransferase